MTLKVHVSLLLALLYNLYFGKKDIFFIAYMFIIMHELAHMIVALILNIDIAEITLLPFGATAKYKGKISLKQEFLISIAGPIASLFFAYIYHNNTYLKINLLIFIFNMLPIYPLDGGRILKVFFVIIFGRKLGNELNKYFEIFILIIIFLLSLYFLIMLKNCSLLLITLYVFKIKHEEIKKEKILSIINYLQIEK